MLLSLTVGPLPAAFAGAVRCVQSAPAHRSHHTRAHAASRARGGRCAAPASGAVSKRRRDRTPHPDDLTSVGRRFTCRVTKTPCNHGTKLKSTHPVVPGIHGGLREALGARSGTTRTSCGGWSRSCSSATTRSARARRRSCSARSCRPFPREPAAEKSDWRCCFRYSSDVFKVF